MSSKHHELLGVPKHANQHRLSRLTMEVHTDELRIMASAVESYTDDLIAALEAAEKRIAELEAREVKLPKPISVLHRRDFIDAHRSIYAYPESEVNTALADAGINIATAGKGD
ncbi:TPA: hypothetical protein ACWLZQ_000625 [Klebsiella pneumoniae]